MPQISVIVPVYKVEQYLHRCVDSILKQTFTDFELILVDDGSPDNCPAICDEYALQDTRVHVIHQENGGLSAARNAGIDWAFANSDSEWLTFIDSDDWVHLEMLERLLDAVTVVDAAVGICGYAETEGEELAAPENSFIVSEWKPEEFYVQHVVNSTVAWGKLYKKDCFSLVRYPVGKIHEDEFTTYKILFAEKKVAVIPAQMYFYFQNQNSIMHNLSMKEKMAGIEACELQISYFQQYNFLKAENYKILGYLMNLKVLMDDISGEYGKNDFYKELRRRKYFKGFRYISRLNLADNESGWVATQVFPRIMGIYWHWKALERKICRFGKR